MSGKLIVLVYSESDQVRVIRQWGQFQGNLRMGVVSVSFNTCQRVCHLPEPARRLSAQLPLSFNKTQYFGSNRSQNMRGNLVCLCVCICLSGIFLKATIKPACQMLEVAKYGNNLILGLVVSEIFETRLSGCQWVWVF